MGLSVITSEGGPFILARACQFFSGAPGHTLRQHVSSWRLLHRPCQLPGPEDIGGAGPGATTDSRPMVPHQPTPVIINCTPRYLYIHVINHTALLCTTSSTTSMIFYNEFRIDSETRLICMYEKSIKFCGRKNTGLTLSHTASENPYHS